MPISFSGLLWSFEMRNHWTLRIAAIAIILFGCISLVQASAQDDPNRAAIAQAIGRSGAPMPGNVFRIAFPRSDLRVRIGDVMIAPGLGLGGYAAFKMEGDTTLVVGDVVLLEREIQPVMTALESNGFHITALHNHLRNETPHVMYMHFMATGDAKTLASQLRAALSLSKTPLGPLKKPSQTEPWFSAAIQAGLGYKGKASNGILAVSVPRVENIMMQGYAIPPSMGVATAMNFEAVGTTRVATTGDFVLIGTEVNAVEQSLKSHGFEVTALHHHMIGDNPQLYYMHFWSVQSAQAIAAGLKDALSHINVKAP
ncbi:MAG: DUF1259 domain-containing protein [Candidatus Baltobacteraceae bacterium]